MRKLLFFVLLLVLCLISPTVYSQEIVGTKTSAKVSICYEDVCELKWQVTVQSRLDRSENLNVNLFFFDENNKEITSLRTDYKFFNPGETKIFSGSLLMNKDRLQSIKKIGTVIDKKVRKIRKLLI